MGDSDDATRLVELTRAKDLFSAQLLKGFLESHEIAARIPDEEVIGVYDGAATIWGGGVRIEVRLKDLDRAREALAAWERR